MTDNNPTTPDSWEPCGSGELQRLAQSMRAKSARISRRELMLKTAVALASVAGIALLAVYVRRETHSPAATDMHYAGISCTEVRESAPDLAAGKIEASRIAQIHIISRQCRHCREMMERIGEPVARSAPASHRSTAIPARSMSAYLDRSPPPH